MTNFCENGTHPHFTTPGMVVWQLLSAYDSLGDAYQFHSSKRKVFQAKHYLFNDNPVFSGCQCGPPVVILMSAFFPSQSCKDLSHIQFIKRFLSFALLFSKSDDEDAPETMRYNFIWRLILFLKLVFPPRKIVHAAFHSTQINIIRVIFISLRNRQSVWSMIREKVM